MRQTILDHVTFGRFTAALPDILGSVDIGMRLVSARATPKLRLITSVALLTVATVGARPAGVARIDQLHQDSCQCRLISDHLVQLPERPRVQNRCGCLTFTRVRIPFSSSIRIPHSVPLAVRTIC